MASQVHKSINEEAKANIPYFQPTDAEDGLSGVDFEFSVDEDQLDGDDTGLIHSDPPPPNQGSEAPAAGIARRRIQGNVYS